MGVLYMEINIESILSEIERADDGALRNEMMKMNFEIDQEKFSFAFSAYGAIKRLSSLDDVIFAGGVAIPPSAIPAIKLRSVVLLKLYVALVYMRSDILERGLDSAPEGSLLELYKKLYRSGCTKKGEDTLPQRIRNALCHDGLYFLMRENHIAVKFNDRQVQFELPINIVDRLCNQIFRFYLIAYEVKNNSNVRV
ncbi:hypothetical protein [Thermomonas flagellata]|uniref:hypothetical protein n=1 Tax=Thermomonas flagellata TaxID=2888524 RepID=UPI001F045940|nr:hypothetical protein [Thermomonas flagellata]